MTTTLLRGRRVIASDSASHHILEDGEVVTGRDFTTVFVNGRTIIRDLQLPGATSTRITNGRSGKTRN